MKYSQAQCALLELQSRVARTTDCYRLDVLERAMDEIVRKFDSSKPSSWQVRSAESNAKKIVLNRRRLAPMRSFDSNGVELEAPMATRPAQLKRPATLADVDAGFADLQCRDLLATLDGLTVRDRILLKADYVGFDPLLIADAEGRDVRRLREQLSRARRRARAAHEQLLAA